MALNIKSPRVEALAAEVAALTGESKTEAIRRALEERRDRLKRRGSTAALAGHLQTFLEREVWARVPVKQRGKGPDKAEREAILGYGESGV